MSEKYSDKNTSGSEYHYDFTEDFNNGAVKKLVISGIYGEVTVKKGDGLRIDATDVPEDYEAVLSEDGRLYAGCRDENNFKFNFFFNGFSIFNAIKEIEAVVEITIPEGAHFEVVEFDGSSGKMNASGISADSFEIDGGSGMISVENVNADKFSLEGGSGMISINGLNAKESFLETASGFVTVNGCDFGRIELDSGSGMVKMTEMKFEEIDLDSGSGLINIEAECAGNIRVSSGSGNVTLVITGSSSSDYRISVDSGSGGVWINGNRLSDDTEMNRDAELSCDIDGGSGRVSVEWK